MRNVNQMLDELEPLISAALDELCTLDDEGVAQTIALAELRHVIDTLQRKNDLDLVSRQRVGDAFEMYQRINEVSEFRSAGRVALLVPYESTRHPH